MNIFRYNINTGAIELVNDELTNLDCIQIIIKTSPTLEFAYREMTYAWWIGYHNSPGNMSGLKGKALANHAKLNLKMPEHWTPSEAVNQLTDLIADESEFAAAKSVKALRRAFTNSDKIIERIDDRIKELLDEATTTTPELVSNLMKFQKDLMTIASEIPARIEALKKAEETLKKEEAKTIIARGGKSVTKSMIPNSNKN